MKRVCSTRNNNSNQTNKISKKFIKQTLTKVTFKLDTKINRVRTNTNSAIVWGYSSYNPRCVIETFDVKQIVKTKIKTYGK